MMKKILLLTMLVGILLTSCSEDEVKFLPSSSITVDVSEVTLFDSPTTVNITSSAQGVTEILLNGGTIVDRSLTVTDGATSTVLTSDDFGAAWAIGEGASFTTTVMFGGSKSVYSFGVDVVEATSITGPSSILEHDSTKTEVVFDAATMGGMIESLKVEKKVITSTSPSPAFTEIASGSNVSEFTFTDAIYGVDYTLTDTIRYMFTATKGNLIEKDSIEIVINSKPIAATMEGMLSDDMDSLVLDESAGVAISFMSSADTRGIASAQVEFSLMDSVINDFSAFVKVVDALTLTSEISNVVIDDIIAFKYTADGKMYYGYLTIDEVTSIGIGDEENSISFMYGYEKKD